MDQPESRPSPWTLQQTLATLNTSSVNGCIDIAQPERGLRKLTNENRTIADGLLRICRSQSTGDRMTGPDWPLRINDAYVRERDLVASYQPTDDWPYAPQIQWHADPFGMVESVSASLAVFVSIQTHLLNTRPAISINTQLLTLERLSLVVADSGRTELRRISDHAVMRPVGTALCVIQRLPNLPLSYLEVVPTTDFCELAVSTPSDQPQLEWRLFSEFLEKGVIRKARVYAAIVPTANDVELAVECTAAIEQSPLPLTA